MTTNAGSVGAKATAGFSPGEEGAADGERRARDRVKGAFAPELLGRMDAVVAFRPLTEQTLEKIAALRLREALDRAEAAGLRVEPDPAFPALLAKQSARDPAGARAIRRLLQTEVLDPAADLILEGAADARLSAEGLRAVTPTP